MKPQHIFGLALRILGLIAITVAVSYLIDLIITVLGIVVGDKQMFELSRWKDLITEYVVRAGLLIVIGLYLLRGAPHVVRFAFRDDKDAA